MKISIDNYTFIPSARRIIFNDYTFVELAHIYPIINVTTGGIIYNPMAPALIGSVTDNELLLSFDTTSMTADDQLMIIYEDGRKAPTADETANAIDENSNWMLRRLVKLLESNAVVDINNRQRVTLDAITAGLILSTVTTVGNIGTIGGIDQRFTLIDAARNTYANGIRTNLIFT